ncbi:TIR domain-containing protein [Myroides odoratimimus]|uniref:TIR domain-containing protein n=1 Tax=Myroides odoratimimus TaxID=76832 RepID=UPI002DBA5615|nr:TIR domain-containing protein [Myroides odoratimimus]MEC4028943.1 TIR domain-containing protein [Myroides odoratimimus]
MSDYSKNIFVSYTTRNENVDKKTLEKIYKIFSKYGDVYIDLLHNDDLLHPQEKVIKKLEIADVLIVLNTKDIDKSEWVKFEIKKSKSRNIEIKYIDIDNILLENFDL